MALVLLAMNRNMMDADINIVTSRDHGGETIALANSSASIFHEVVGMTWIAYAMRYTQDCG